MTETLLAVFLCGVAVGAALCTLMGLWFLRG